MPKKIKILYTQIYLSVYLFLVNENISQYPNFCHTQAQPIILNHLSHNLISLYFVFRFKGSTRKKRLPTLEVKSQFKHINLNSKTSRLFQKREMHSCFILKFAAIFKNSGVFLPRQQTRGSSLDRPEGAPFRFMDSYKDAYLFRLCHYPLLNGNLG